MKRENLKIKIAGLIFLLGFLLFFLDLKIIEANSPDNPFNPPAGTNIRLCVDSPGVDVSNPSQPIFRWTTSGNPQTQYWLLVDDNPPVFDVYRYVHVRNERGLRGPRCPCDRTLNPDCPSYFSATVLDPHVCYDQFVTRERRGWLWWRRWVVHEHSRRYEKRTFPNPRPLNTPPYVHVLNTGIVTSGNNFHQTLPNQLAQNRTYWWCVAVRDAHGWTGWTGCYSFFLPSRAPSATNLAVPQPRCYSCDICNNGPQPTLRWTFSDPDHNDHQSAYQVQIANDINFSSLILNTGRVSSGNTFYNVPSRVLICGTTYHWRVKVWDRHNVVSSWANSSFTTSPVCNRSPSATNLGVRQPDYCISGPAAIFSWTFTDPDLHYPACNERQTAYRLQVDNNSNFSSPEDDSGKVRSSLNSYATPLGKLSYNTTYYWRLMVWDRIDVASGWISGPSFTTPKHKHPRIDFNWSPREFSVNEVVLFTDQSTVYGGAFKAAWSWTFEDGLPSSSSEQNPEVKFRSVGAKTVTLRVTDSSGYSCQGQKITPEVELPLPEWKEVPPVIWLKKLLASLQEFFKNIYFAFRF